MKKLQPKIFIDTEVSLETGYNISTGYSIGQVIHFNDTGKEYYHSTNGVWKEYGSPAKDTYSYDEKIIGEWVDGKPIYRKVFLIPQPDENLTISIIHNLGIDECIRMDITSNSEGAERQPVSPMMSNTTPIFSPFIATDRNSIQMQSVEVDTAFTYHLILEYTKL